MMVTITCSKSKINKIIVIVFIEKSPYFTTFPYLVNSCNVTCGSEQKQWDNFYFCVCCHKIIIKMCRFSRDTNLRIYIDCVTLCRSLLVRENGRLDTYTVLLLGAKPPLIITKRNKNTKSIDKIQAVKLLCYTSQKTCKQYNLPTESSVRK